MKQQSDAAIAIARPIPTPASKRAPILVVDSQSVDSDSESDSKCAALHSILAEIGTPIGAKQPNTKHGDKSVVPARAPSVGTESEAGDESVLDDVFEVRFRFLRAVPSQ